jgi:hypothetical protein
MGKKVAQSHAEREKKPHKLNSITAASELATVRRVPQLLPILPQGGPASCMCTGIKLVLKQL